MLSRRGRRKRNLSQEVQEADEIRHLVTKIWTKILLVIFKLI